MVRGHSGSPDGFFIVEAAGALGAVVFNLLKSAETGTNIGAMLGGFGKGGVVEAIGRIRGIRQDSAAVFMTELRKLSLRAAAHCVYFSIMGVLGVREGPVLE